MEIKNSMLKAFRNMMISFVLTSIGFSIHAEQSLNLSIWNMEWFVSKGDKKFEPSLRDKDDLDKMADYFKSLDTSVLAFQEVGDENVLKSIIGNDYNIFLSDRAQAKNKRLQFDGLNQYTGFAIKKSIPVKDVSDFSLLPSNRNDKLRFASYLILNPDSTSPIHLLSVHLKAGCPSAYKKSNNCSTLKTQGQSLNQWIKEREKNKESYIISGDFNHNLAYKKDWLWTEISQSNKAVLASRKMPSKCEIRSRNDGKKTHRFPFSIDHLITSDDIKTHSVEQKLFSKQDVLTYQLSDHCPINATLEAVN